MNSKDKSPYGCLTNSHWISNLKPECVEVNQLESFVQKVQGFILLLIMFMFSKQEVCFKLVYSHPPKYTANTRHRNVTRS